VLIDVAGPGVIQHIWMVEGLNRGLVLRFYWDGEATPSVERRHRFLRRGSRSLPR